MKTIFLLEDDGALCRGIAMALSAPERAVTQADSIARAREALSGARFDLLILDINLPDGSGLELLRALRQEGDRTPAILLTANDLELDGFTFDFARLEFAKDGAPIDLSKTEQRLLRLLVENRGRTLPRELLLERVWDGGEFVDENALSVAVGRLRAKLGGAPIKTVYGVGYTWEVGK